MQPKPSTFLWLSRFGRMSSGIQVIIHNALPHLIHSITFANWDNSWSNCILCPKYVNSSSFFSVVPFPVKNVSDSLIGIESNTAAIQQMPRALLAAFDEGFDGEVSSSTPF
ncbi:uncharacterized protein LOC131220848 isoform X2 [Magnolia sinica]|uniref:uncharacterized protein LOC131220848 isoform X2 n=1 Tax=Magnolia sinica TaxID=86752 RepID=UPI002657EDB5|nr:uncharacterized protein LOC131220848 isoform X2 [Magnolia sinica]